MSGLLDPTNFKHSVEVAAANHGKIPEHEVIELPAGGGVFHDAGLGMARPLISIANLDIH
ncbi:MAG: hypothetical protein CMM56_00820 [Rhodospirillaceae bacterium]|nr:hypothetical protein [Rhodospirillaceae bacterium]